MGNADAGGATEDIFDVENVIMGSGDDHVTGSSLDNDLSGNGGDDTLIGLAGDDYARRRRRRRHARRRRRMSTGSTAKPATTR